MAYEEVAEEFAEQCRVRARVVSLGADGAGRMRASDADRHDLVVTVGQEALDARAGHRGARDPDAGIRYAARGSSAAGLAAARARS